MSLIPVPSRWYEPFGESLSRLTVDSKTTSEFTVFNLVIRLSKVNCWPFFRSHLSLSLSMCCHSLPLYWASPFFQFHHGLRSWKPRRHLLFSVMPKRQTTCLTCLHDQATGHPCRYVFFFLVVGEVEMCT